MLEMASFLKYVDLYVTSEWGRFYVGNPVCNTLRRDKIFVGKEKGNDNSVDQDVDGKIIMHIKKRACTWACLPWDRNRWPTLVSAVINPGVS
jgi:hypothetical protein